MSETDLQLLARYRRDRSEGAFAELVRRHVDLVYSAALRQVRSPHIAEEVAQGAFLKLARHAERVAPNTVVAAWLYQVARREAIDALRLETRRRLRDQTAAEMNAINATPDEWRQIEPLLDEAMDALDETDRAAVLLRFFENKSLREVGLALGTSDDAAQKRVSRAVDRLRNFFRRRGVAASATGLGIVLSANAVQAAPAGLAAGVCAAALSGAVVNTSTALAVSKAIVMTTAQKGLIGATLAIAVGTGIYQAKQASNLRERAATLQQQQAAAMEQSARSTAERDEALQAAAAARIDLDAAQKDKAELLRQRSEVDRMQQQIGATREGSALSAIAQPPAAAGQPDQWLAAQDEMARLGLAASRGDVSALDKLAELSAAAANGRTNVNQDTHADIRVAFKVLGEEAGRGNEVALQMIWRATRMKYLQGMATMALGQAAAMGNDKALEPLLDPERYLLLQSTAVSALKPAAENGNERAIQALAAVASDTKKQALWYGIAQALQKPAEAGNSTAIDALAAISRSENKETRKVALIALESAGFKQNPKALEALRALGYQ